MHPGFWRALAAAASLAGCVVSLGSRASLLWAFVFLCSLNAPRLARLHRRRELTADRRKTEAEIALVRERMLTLADALPIMVAYLGREGATRFANRRWAEWCGSPSDSFHGLPPAALLGERGWVAAEPHLREAFGGGSPSFEAELAAPGGKTMWGGVDLMPDRGLEGGVRGVYLLVHDITVRKRAEERLLQKIREVGEKNQRLREIDHLKSEFLATASHELRTPLTIIREYVSLVRDRLMGEISEDQRQALDTALRNCDRLGDIINNILDLQAIQNGRMRFQWREVPLEPLLRECWRDFLPSFERKGQRLILEVEEDLPPVLCDPDKIRQVVVNLLGNAQKFTPEGGTIAVRAQLWEAAEGSRLRVAVTDSGPGIPESQQAAVFDPYVQVERLGEDVVPRVRGSGLGLGIARGIIEAHHGTLTLESVPGEGSSFIVSLPPYGGQDASEAAVDRELEGVAASQALAEFLAVLDPGSGNREAEISAELDAALVGAEEVDHRGGMQNPGRGR